MDRASPGDLMQLAADVGPAPMHVGAVLLLGTRPGFSVQKAEWLLGGRVRAATRLRQRLHRAPPCCGRPLWADDPAFDLRVMSGSGRARRLATSGHCSTWPQP